MFYAFQSNSTIFKCFEVIYYSMKTGIKVSDAMSQKPVTIEPTKTIFECAKIMLKKRVGSLLIVKDNNLQGIITEKDLVHFIANGLDPKKIIVSKIMVTKVDTITPDVDLYEALIKMKTEKIRRLPVVHNKKLIGMLTTNDILKIQPALFDILSDQAKIESSKKDQKPVEGECELCENYGKLYEVDGQFLCEGCRAEQQ